MHHGIIHANNVKSPSINDALFRPILIESDGDLNRTTSPHIALIDQTGVHLTASDYQGMGIDWIAKVSN